ncbi:unnamed protein product [Protopolystoma xenopodis]|uniref:Uncharacterized protein n=1 Tax=Protopolystoma xenopodis TaxID=117903 RepID=A0A448XM25_9PLAT|nr:unnamed protein product [Protopolystoma xenopodis]
MFRNQLQSHFASITISLKGACHRFMTCLRPTFLDAFTAGGCLARPSGCLVNGSKRSTFCADPCSASPIGVVVGAHARRIPANGTHSKGSDGYTGTGRGHLCRDEMKETPHFPNLPLTCFIFSPQINVFQAGSCIFKDQHLKVVVETFYFVCKKMAKRFIG